MKSEATKTLIFLAAAAVLVVAAATIDPGSATPQIFSDQGQALFPDYTDPLAVKAIEVVDYDPDQAVAEPLKVEFQDNRWVIPSNNDYPAEAADRMASTAGALMGLHKDIVVSDRIDDQAKYGVIDPLDQDAASLTGRGKHVTLRDEKGQVLAELVLGNTMPDHAGYRYVRLPGQNRIYGVHTDADPSARFSDWVDPNLLDLTAADLSRITLNLYSIDETFGRIVNSVRVNMTKNSAGKWTATGDRKPSSDDIQKVADKLAAIRIEGAGPKPEALAKSLASGEGLELTMDGVNSLRQHGYFVTGQGQMYANEGELVAETSKGIVYTLRFGEIVAGGIGRSSSGDQTASDDANASDQSASADSADSADSTAQDRYLFVTATNRNDDSASRAKELSRRFAGWYYAISGADFNALTMR